MSLFHVVVGPMTPMKLNDVLRICGTTSVATRGDTWLVVKIDEATADGLRVAYPWIEAVTPYKPVMLGPPIFY